MASQKHDIWQPLAALLTDVIARHSEEIERHVLPRAWFSGSLQKLFDRLLAFLKERGKHRRHAVRFCFGDLAVWKDHRRFHIEQKETLDSRDET